MTTLPLLYENGIWIYFLIITENHIILIILKSLTSDMIYFYLFEKNILIMCPIT